MKTTEKVSVFYCTHCNRIKSYLPDITSGYALNDDDEKICFDCCAVIDRDFMIENGRITLYLSFDTPDRGQLNNWPSTLKFLVSIKKGRHNFAINRYDVWFDGPDDYVWHGVQYGDDTQLCHCKRTRQRS